MWLDPRLDYNIRVQVEHVQFLLVRLVNAEFRSPFTLHSCIDSRTLQISVRTSGYTRKCELLYPLSNYQSVRLQEWTWALLLAARSACSSWQISHGLFLQ